MAPLIVRPEYRALLRSALIGIGTAALGLLAVSWCLGQRLQLSGWFVLKSELLFTAGALLLLRALPRYHPFTTLGAANHTTTIRGALIALLAALIGEHAAAPFASIAVMLALLVTLLDGLDGQLARRTGMVSTLGARFDMESDAVFVAVLSVLAWQFDKVGPWVLLSGLMRYLFAAAAVCIPLLRQPVPSSYRGKTIAVLQMLALIVALAPGCPRALSTRVAALALSALALSFALDIFGLRQSQDAGRDAQEGIA
jgi:phosphatidylglycerophosphate synthase